jgi:CRP-like cAMP-binding protein
LQSREFEDGAEAGGMDDQSDVEVLGRTELFRGAPLDLLAEVQRASFRKRFAAGEAIVRQGDPPATVYVVVVGRLRVTQTTLDGQQVIIRYLGPGEVVGYAALVDGDAHPGSVIAVDDCHLIGWSATVVRDIMSRHSLIAINVARILGGRYLDMQVRLRELSTEKVERRIAHTILRLVEQAGRRTARGIEIAFPLSRQDLAEMSGTTLHTVSRTLSAWEERGIVDCGRRRVVVAKSQLLESIAEEQA